MSAAAAAEPRPLLEVLQEHVDQVHAQRECRCACHLTPTPKPGHICKAAR